MTNQHQQERERFLESLYKAACENNSGQPSSASINPMEIGNSLGFNETTTTRIVTELRQDNHIVSSRDMRTLNVTRAGVVHLEELLREESSPTPSNTISLIGITDSNIILQQAATNSSQVQRTTTQTDIGRTELTALAQELKATLSDVQRYLPEHQAEDYSTDVLQLEKQLTRSELDKGRIYRILESLSNNFYTIPAAITANWLTEPVAQILKEGFKLLAQ